MRLFKWSFGLFAAVLVTFMSLAPAAHAELKLCGHPWAKPDALQKQFEADKSYKEIHRDKYYLAFQNEDEATVWTFTLPGTPAHPAVICRRPTRDGDLIKLEMDVNCLGDSRACDSLVQDFRRLNSEMAKAMNKQQNKQ